VTRTVTVTLLRRRPLRLAAAAVTVTVVRAAGPGPSSWRGRSVVDFKFKLLREKVVTHDPGTAVTVPGRARN
jgi:hypothetical protein